MKIVFLVLIFAMVMLNFWCFYKSRKYLNKVEGDDSVSEENYKKGLKYIKISVFVSPFTKNFSAV